MRSVIKAREKHSQNRRKSTPNIVEPILLYRTNGRNIDLLRFDHHETKETTHYNMQHCCRLPNPNPNRTKTDATLINCASMIAKQKKQHANVVCKRSQHCCMPMLRAFAPVNARSLCETERVTIYEKLGSVYFYFHKSCRI